MNALDRLLIGCILAAGVLFAGMVWVEHYGETKYASGYAAAVAAGQAQYDRDAAAARQTESDLRAQVAAREAAAIKKEHEYATNLEAAQRRVLTGVDRLRCPAASPVPAGAPPGDRPAAGAAAADGPGAELVPEAAADVLGIGATIAGIVRKYDEVVADYDKCRAVNAK